jgi:uncharacterized membrane protein HdeD (DUF308 family)
VTLEETAVIVVLVGVIVVLVGVFQAFHAVSERNREGQHAFVELLNPIEQCFE